MPKHSDEQSPPLYKEILFTEQEVNARIAEMATENIELFGNLDSKPQYVSILHGSQPFADALMRAITRQDPYFHPDLKGMAISRYGKDREPGKMRVAAPLPGDVLKELPGKLAIILDDLIDRGDTIDFARQYLLKHGAVAVKAEVLVKKKIDPPTATEIAMFGFETPDVWLTGMGMDDSRIHPEANRWAGWIAIANSD